jgi:hypothetical protein
MCSERRVGRSAAGKKDSRSQCGENPLTGVVFNYYLKKSIRLCSCIGYYFRQASKPIKTFSSKAKEAGDKIDFHNGMNQFAWDMLYPPGENSGWTDIMEWRRGRRKS